MCKNEDDAYFMQKTKKEKLALLLPCLFIVTFLFIGVLVVARSNANVALQPNCTDLDEVDHDYCTSGEDADYHQLPEVQDYGTDFIEAAQASDAIALYRGVNLAGGETGHFDAPNTDGMFVPDNNAALLFVYKGMNIFALPVLWEFLYSIEGTIGVTTPGIYNNPGLQASVRQALLRTVASLRQSKAVVIITLYNDMNYVTMKQNGQPNNVLIGTCEGLLCGPIDQYNNSAPGLQAVANLWGNVVRLFRFHEAIVYNVVNHVKFFGVTQGLLNNYTKRVRRAVRFTEQVAGTYTHLLILPCIQQALISKWFVRDAQGASNAENPLFLLGNQERASLDDDTMLGVHQYFDADQSGTYASGECVTIAEFDDYFGKFINWVRDNKWKIFISELGVPPTASCITLMSHVLTVFSEYAYSPSLQFGIIGWTLWSADTAPNYAGPMSDTRRRHLSLAPGDPANSLMWNGVLYERFLTPIAQPLPPLSSERLAIIVRNDSPDTLFYDEGFIPFQFVGSADVLPGESIRLYSNSGSATPSGPLRLVYRIASPPMGILFVTFRETRDFGLLPEVVVRAFLVGIRHAVLPDRQNCSIPISGVFEPDIRCYHLIRRP